MGGHPADAARLTDFVTAAGPRLPKPTFKLMVDQILQIGTKPTSPPVAAKIAPLMDKAIILQRIENRFIYIQQRLL
jgi:hypothetical protein